MVPVHPSELFISLASAAKKSDRRTIATLP